MSPDFERYALLVLGVLALLLCCLCRLSGGAQAEVPFSALEDDCERAAAPGEATVGEEMAGEATAATPCALRSGGRADLANLFSPGFDDLNAPGATPRREGLRAIASAAEDAGAAAMTALCHAQRALASPPAEKGPGFEAYARRGSLGEYEAADGLMTPSPGPRTAAACTQETPDTFSGLSDEMEGCLALPLSPPFTMPRRGAGL